MKLILVRHGQTNWNKIGKVQGGLSDIKLNNVGKDQAKKTAVRLKNENIDLIFSSPMIRAKETTNFINKYYNYDIYIDKRLKERNFGDFEGTNYEDLIMNMETVFIDDSYEKFKIERIEKFKKRLEEFIYDIKNKYFGKTILIVSHSSTSKMILSIILNKHINEIRKKYLKENASISIIEFDENKIVKNINIGDVSHL